MYLFSWTDLILINGPWFWKVDLRWPVALRDRCPWPGTRSWDSSGYFLFPTLHFLSHCSFLSQCEFPWHWSILTQGSSFLKNTLGQFQRIHVHWDVETSYEKEKRVPVPENGDWVRGSWHFSAHKGKFKPKKCSIPKKGQGECLESFSKSPQSTCYWWVSYVIKRQEWELVDNIRFGHKFENGVLRS